MRGSSQSRECIVYARVSSKEQEREGYSIPAQLELLREYARRNSFVVVQEYTEAETAKSAGREQFNQLLKDLQCSKSPTVLLVEKTDRLYRNFKDYNAINDLMNERDIEVHLAKEGEVLSRSSNSHVKFIHGIKVLMAKNYCDNLSEETKKGQRQKAMEGGWSWAPPYGYRMEKGKLIADPERSIFVKQAFSEYATGLYSLEECTKRLRQKGLIYRPYNVKISDTKLHKMLSSRIYVGEIDYKGEIYPGAHEPLVSWDVWRQAQKQLKNRAKPLSSNKKPFLFRGLLRCGECGNLLSPESKKKASSSTTDALTSNKSALKAISMRIVLESR